MRSFGYRLLFSFPPPFNLPPFLFAAQLNSGTSPHCIANLLRLLLSVSPAPLPSSTRRVYSVPSLSAFCTPPLSSIYFFFLVFSRGRSASRNPSPSVPLQKERLLSFPRARALAPPFRFSGGFKPIFFSTNPLFYLDTFRASFPLFCAMVLFFLSSMIRTRLFGLHPQERSVGDPLHGLFFFFFRFVSFPLFEGRIHVCVQMTVTIRISILIPSFSLLEAIPGANFWAFSFFSRRLFPQKATPRFSSATPFVFPGIKEK